MTVNAFSQDSSHQPEQQEPVALMVLNGDGSVTMHPALAQSMMPGLSLSSILTGQQYDRASTSNGPLRAPTLRNVGTSSGTTAQCPQGSGENRLASVKNHYENAVRENFRKGRIWASRIRHLSKRRTISRYEAMQIVAQENCVPVTEVRSLVELHNKAANQRAHAIRQNLVWTKHLAGATDKEIAQALGIHPKTVAKDRRKMKAQQLGGYKNDY